MKKFLLITLILVLFIPIISQAQIKDPTVPRTWWNDLKTFIVQTSEYVFGYRVDATTTVSDTIAVFMPTFNMEIQIVDLSFLQITDPDSTMYLVFSSSGTLDTVLTIDSTGNGQTLFWQTSTAFNLTADDTVRIILNAGADTVTSAGGSITIHARNK